MSFKSMMSELFACCRYNKQHLIFLRHSDNFIVPNKRRDWTTFCVHMAIVCVSLCGYTELMEAWGGQHVVQQVIDDVTHEHQKLLSKLLPRSFSWNHMLFFRFSEARCVPTARAVASLFLPVFSPVWRWALKTKVLLHGVMLWVISETVGDGLLSALKGEWHDYGLLCCTKGSCSAY